MGRTFGAISSTMALCLSFLTWAAASPAAAIDLDLGDLQVPASRIPNFDPGVIGGIPDTSGWPVVDATSYGATPNDSSDDTSAINSAINSASNSGTNTVVFLPEGTYRFSHGTDVRMRSNVVLRGAGPEKTIITGINGTGPAQSGLQFIGGLSGSAISITSPSLPRGTSELVLADASSLAAGDWVYMVQDNDPSYIQKPKGGKLYMAHIFRIDAKVGNTITMNRPLLHEFGTSFNPRVTKMNPVKNAGIENLKIMFDRDTGGDNGVMTVLMQHAVNCWAKNVFFFNGYKNHIQIAFSARNTITGSRFERLAKYEDEGETSSVYSIQFEEAAVDNLVTNNVSVNLHNALIFQRGPSGNVYSYNFHAGRKQHKGILFHGQYPHDNLVEGVDSEYAPFQIGDNFWGQNGPRNSAFRNRLRNTAFFMVHEAGTTDLINEDFNLLLNSGFSFHRKPFCNYEEKGNCGDVDSMTEGFWAERNFATDTTPDGSPSGSSSYGFVLRTPRSTTTMIETEHEGVKAPSDWQGKNFPASLYLTGPPDFWGEGMPWPAIGADVDNHSATFVKLPAQLRYEADPQPSPPYLLPP